MEQRNTDLTKVRTQTHNVIIEAKRHVRITGVIDVESFQEDAATIVTLAGILSIYGAELHLCRLNPDDGQIILDGDIQSLEYEPPASERRGLFGRARG